MLKLYKKEEAGLVYWETWDKDNRTGVIHWGIVGEEGESKEIKSGIFSDFRTNIQKLITMKMDEGFREFPDESLATLVIEYKVEGFGTTDDLTKRERLEARLNEFLGWRGLGHSDGGSIGSGSMEVACLVVDFGVAKKS